MSESVSVGPSDTDVTVSAFNIMMIMSRWKINE